MENLNFCLNYHLSGILRQRTRDVELKKYCVTLLETFGSLSYTRHTLEELDAELRAEVAKLGGNPMLEDVLNEMLDWKRGTDEKHPAK
jgi:geranylgeranyl diphosphate synthase type 3